MKLFIRCMVSVHCKIRVREIFDSAGLSPVTIELGEVEICENITADLYALLRSHLAKSGFELIDDKKAILTEKIKYVIVHMVHYAENLPDTKNSRYISNYLNMDYRYLARVFSEETGTTIEQYIILQKIEKVKEYLLYDELSLTQISYLLHYSSVAHLSFQFKKLTGLTPSKYKQAGHNNRIPLDRL